MDPLAAILLSTDAGIDRSFSERHGGFWMMLREGFGLWFLEDARVVLDEGIVGASSSENHVFIN